MEVVVRSYSILLPPANAIAIKGGPPASAELATYWKPAAQLWYSA
jgi:hypothetical protein